MHIHVTTLLISLDVCHGWDIEMQSLSHLTISQVGHEQTISLTLSHVLPINEDNSMINLTNVNLVTAFTANHIHVVR